MHPSTAAVDVPATYTSLDLPHIKVAHVPGTSTTPTPVILITLNRPSKNNAFTVHMQQSLEQVYRMIDADDRVKAVVLTGSGKMFCAGADLEIGFLGAGTTGEKFPSMGERDVNHRDGGGRVALAIHQCSKPTIAAIQGSAVGIGITMCLPATIRVAYAKAKIGFVFSRRGIIMEACSSYFLPRLIGFSRALHLTTTGSAFPADHKLLSDLFSEVLPTPEATLQRALEIADDIAKNTSVLSNKLMRDLMYRGPNSAEEAHLLDSRVIHGMYGSKDNLEGVHSFFEKRAPGFQASMKKDAPKVWPWWSQVDVELQSAQPPEKSKL